MTTPVASKTYGRFALIAAVLREKYGVSPELASPVTILWAADAVRVDGSVVEARRELRAINSWRERQGKMPAYPEWGTALFGK